MVDEEQFLKAMKHNTRKKGGQRRNDTSALCCACSNTLLQVTSAAGSLEREDSGREVTSRARGKRTGRANGSTELEEDEEDEEDEEEVEEEEACNASSARARACTACKRQGEGDGEWIHIYKLPEQPNRPNAKPHPIKEATARTVAEQYFSRHPR